MNSECSVSWDAWFMQIGLGQFLAIHPRLLEVACSTHSYVQLERRKEAETAGLVPEDDPRTLPDDRGNFAIMHAIARGNNSMAALLDACGSSLNSNDFFSHCCFIRSKLKVAIELHGCICDALCRAI